MHVSRGFRQSFLTLLTVLFATAAFAQATSTPAKPAGAQDKPAGQDKPTGQFEPRVGQPGKDVVWVPTPQALVDKMLDMAKVTPNDFVMDLGSGDGRTVITAAKRGATAMGIEYNPDMVELSKRNAQKEGVTAKATFVQADLFKTDSEQGDGHHDVPAAEHQHAAAAVDPQPEAGHAHRGEHVHDGRLGCRRDAVGDRQLLELVHGASVDCAGEGTGHVEDAAGQPHADAEFQNVTGNLNGTAITAGKLNGDQISLTAGGTTYTGRVNAAGNAIAGGNLNATKLN